VILIRNMEGDGGRHFLLDKSKPLLHGIVASSNDVDVEVVLVEAIKNYLDVALI
jgi:hypothetical protein